MTGFVDLQRRFRELTDSELEDIDVLVSWSGSEFGPDVGWSKLLEYPRVILLAEAGAGKTAEMQEQANRLAGEDQFAFFIPLESLDRGSHVDVPDLLSVVEEARFEQWKADGGAPPWFFLDAVDELKLTQGKLDRALNRLARAIEGHLDRARIIISCSVPAIGVDGSMLVSFESDFTRPASRIREHELPRYASPWRWHRAKFGP